jgi:hypothetical protein
MHCGHRLSHIACQVPRNMMRRNTSLMNTARPKRAALASLLLLQGGCADMLVMDYSHYGTVCGELAYYQEARCSDQMNNSSDAVVNCQIAELTRAGVYAVNDDAKVHCLEPFRPFRNTTAALFHSCRYMLVRAEGKCYTAVRYGHESDIKACVIHEMANPSFVGLYGIGSSSSFEFRKGYDLKPGSDAEFQCSDEVVLGRGQTGWH